MEYTNDGVREKEKKDDWKEMIYAFLSGVRLGVAGHHRVSRKDRELGEQGRSRWLGTLRPGVDVTAREAGVARVSSHGPTWAAVTAATADAERRGCTRRTNGCTSGDTAGGEAWHGPPPGMYE